MGVFLHTLKCKLACFRNHLSKIKVIADAGQQVDKMMVTVTKPLENAIKKILT
jgi:hypothetical protein